MSKRTITFDPSDPASVYAAYSAIGDATIRYRTARPPEGFTAARASNRVVGYADLVVDFLRRQGGARRGPLIRDAIGLHWGMWTKVRALLTAKGLIEESYPEGNTIAYYGLKEPKP